MARRKKTTVTKENKHILEYKGWKAGDRCYTVFAGETKPSLCDIKYFHPNDHMTPSVALIDVTTGKHRVAAMMAISEDAKAAKQLQPKWTKFYARWKKKQIKLIREARAEAAAARAAELENATEEETPTTEEVQNNE
tara:strand:+ start:203 stop:613 length:411 start_codon:yes stop_codon:yes gene_type:complete